MLLRLRETRAGCLGFGHGLEQAPPCRGRPFSPGERAARCGGGVQVSPKGRTWPRMWHKATVLPAGTQVGCSLAPVLPANIIAAVAPVPTDFADESAFVSLRAVAKVLVLWSLGGMACQRGSLIRSMLT